MKLSLIQPKVKTEDFLPSIIKNCETLIEQIQTQPQPQETLEFKMTKPRETFRFNPPFQIEEDWMRMIGLMDLEVYNSIFNINTTNNRFELYTDIFNEFTFMDIKDELEEIFNLEEITPNHHQVDILGPLLIKFYKTLKAEKSSTDVCFILLTNYAKSPFRDFESYLRIVIGLDEDDIHSVLNQYNSNFVTYEIPPGVYTIKDFSEAIYTIADRVTLQIEYNDATTKTKLTLSPFVMFERLLGFTSHWNYKPTKIIHAKMAGVYASEKT